MIQTYFRDLTELKGVEAVILYDNHYRILDSWRIAQFNANVFTEMGEAFLHIFGLTEFLQANMNEICIPYDKGIIYARNHSRFFIVVIAKLSIEIPLLRLTMNVCMRELEADRKGRKWLKKLPTEKFYQIKTSALDDVEKIMLENILEEYNGRR
ncbi:MAG: hypothetical protein D6748_04380 [Calditrichaeota bacterium]|nr:MAG: hypothetical protein D6748_04380 [Calditrichota bacterium]